MAYVKSEAARKGIELKGRIKMKIMWRRQGLRVFNEFVVPESCYSVNLSKYELQVSSFGRVRGVASYL